MTPKTFKIKSFGCQMNVYDGERMAELLSANGMAPAAHGEDADRKLLARHAHDAIAAALAPSGIAPARV